tara:strand:- start:1426 stop:2532 length:1107 start_codon:yes stop_codon:yes gene_type:complete
MDTSDPKILFDQKGRSNHFLHFHKYVKPNWSLLKDSPQQRLENKIRQIKAKSKDQEFDCILGLSGGLDSSYMLHKIVVEYNLKPLVFHVDAGWNSEIAVHNINKLVDKLNLDLFTEVINWEEIKNFQLAMFKSGVPHLDVPQDMAFIGILYRFAEKHNIKTILNGGNISTECINPPLNILYWPTDMTQVKDILKRYNNYKLKSYPFSSIYYSKIWIKFFRRIEVFKPLNYINYIQKDAIDELKTIYGWKPYSQKHFESRFTRFFEGYWLPKRFGYDMRRNQLSSLILTNQISRLDAIEKLKSPALDETVANNEFSYIAKKLDIKTDELLNYLEMPLKFYWDYSNQKRLFDIGEKIFIKLFNIQRGGAY